MDTSGIQDKVRKLLALAGSPNEHEAALALAKAQELLARYHLEMGDVKSEQYKRQSAIMEEFDDETLVGLGLEWQNTLAHTVAYSFLCTTIRHTSARWELNKDGDHEKVQTATLSFIGRPEDVAIAIDVYHWIRDQIIDWEDNEYNLIEYGYAKRGRGVPVAFSQKWQRSFYLGCVSSVKERMDATMQGQAQTKALVVSTRQELSQWMNARYRLTSGQQRSPALNSAAYELGKTRGANIALGRRPKMLGAG